MKKLLLITLFLTLILSGLQAQNQTVRGTVTSKEDGEPMIGVSVLLQGTSKGASTGIDGTYTLEVAPGENVLVFSFIGYKPQTVEINSRSTVDVVMESDATELNEVVVVGYGVQKKTDITGATANIKGAELLKQPVLTATQALQGKVAGVQIISSGQPGTQPQIRIRGVGTINGGANALYVVDGVLTDDITNVNSSDIVDMSILKDASASAIYGSRGANGVVLITTKKGQQGAIKINYNNSIGFRQAANLVKMANASEYANYVEAATGDSPTSNYDTDWFDSILRNAWMQNHNVSVSGGSEKTTHYMNIGYLNEDGIMLNNNFKRFTMRLNSDYQLHKTLKFGHQFSYNNNINNNGFNNINIDAFGNIGGAFNNAYRAAPVIPDKVGGRYGNTSAFQGVGNPVLDLSNNKIRVKENRLQGNAFLEFKPLEWLTLRSSVGGDWRNTVGRAYNYQFNADETTFLVSGGSQLRARSGLGMNFNQSFRWVIDNIATATKSFGEHDFTFLVGATTEKLNSTSLSANRDNVPANPDLWYISVGDANTSTNGGGGDAWSRQSFLARVNYAFKEKYLLTATLRADGSSRLPSQNRWQQYPSFGAAWIISRENFFQGQEIFDFLKLRASYGKVGNDQIPTDSYTQSINVNSPYPYQGGSSAATNGGRILRIIDPNITWETTTEYDLALEFSLIQAKLTGEVNYYDKSITDLLVNIGTVGTAGDEDGLIFQNVASVKNRGIEVALNWKSNIGDNWTYTVGGNVTFNKNSVTDIGLGRATQGGSVGGQGFVTTTDDNGHPIGSFFVLKTMGVFNTVAEVNAYVNEDGDKIQPTAKPGDFKYKDVNGDGQIDNNDYVFAGSYQPVAYFGINLGVTYKNFDLSADFYGNVGNEVYNGKKAARYLGTDNIESDIVYSRWTSANRNQDEPGANTGNLPASDYFVESGDFFRLNNITVGYTFPSSVLSKIKVSSLRIFATSQNLFTLKKYSGFTAELPGSPISSGIEMDSYPTTRTFAMGLNVGF